MTVGQERPDRIWIAWERQRRSLGLAARLGARLCLFLDEDRGWLRYPLSAAKTLRLWCGLDDDIAAGAGGGGTRGHAHGTAAQLRLAGGEP